MMGFDLRAPEICLIIETCAAKGVSVLKFGPLHIEFGQPASLLPTIPYPVSALAARPPVTEMTDQKHDRQTAEAIEAEEIKLRQDQLDQMFIEDPVKAEQMVRDGELDDADDEPEHDE